MTFRNVSSCNKLHSRPSLFGRFMHNSFTCSRAELSQLLGIAVRCLAHTQLSLCRRGVIRKRLLSVTTGRSSDLKQSVTLVIPQAAWNWNLLVFSCKVQGERSLNLEEADIQDVFQLSCCWVTYEGPQTAESTQWSKGWTMFRHCCGEVTVDSVLRRNLQVGNHSFLWGWQYHRIWAHD